MDTRHRQSENLSFSVNKPVNQIINLDKYVRMSSFLSFDFLF